MYDIQKTKKNFNKYLEKYDYMNNPDMNRKYYHSFRVMDNAKMIAKSLDLTEEEIFVSTVIGLLHDIGRFEQIKKFNTFKDGQSFDHGEFGATLLKNSLRDYIEIENYDDIILEAIRNHNKFAINSNLTQRQMLFSKIIRDADKLDILYESTEIFWKGKEKSIETLTISDYVYNSILNKKLIKYRDDIVLNDLDSVITTLAFIFDLNFPISIKTVYKNNYIDKVLNRFNFQNTDTINRINKIKQILFEKKI